MINRWISILLVCMGGLSARADLQWKDKTVHLNVHPAQLKATATYAFTNKGNHSVDILDIVPSCGCLFPMLEKRTFEPNESGVLSVVFDLDGRVGPQRKDIKVVSRGNTEKTETLHIEANVPEAFTLSSKRLVWEKEENRIPKICHLSNVSDIPIGLTTAQSSQPAVKVELKPIKPGHEYDLVIDPSTITGNKNVYAVIRIGMQGTTDFKETKTIKVYVIVK